MSNKYYYYYLVCFTKYSLCERCHTKHE